MFALLAFVLVILGLHWLKLKGIEIQVNWIVVGLFPILFWLLFSGKITSIKAGDIELTTVFREATETKIEIDHDFIQFQRLEYAHKEGLIQLNRYAEKRLAVLSFQLKLTGYYVDDIIGEYVRKLFQHGLKWVMFETTNATFVGVVPAASILTYVETSNGSGWSKLKSKIEGGHVTDLPEFIGSEKALLTTATKEDALRSLKEWSRTSFQS